MKHRSTLKRKNVRRIRIGELTEADKLLLINYGEGGAKFAAVKMDTTIQYVYQRIHRLKKKLERWTNFVNYFAYLKGKYPRIRKSFTVIPKETWER